MPFHFVSFFFFGSFALAKTCKISEVHAQNKIPILVGGTHYFIESVIWDKLINTDVTYSRQIERDTSVSTEALYSKLEEVDAKMAARLHPHDRRKISRSLQVCLAVVGVVLSCMVLYCTSFLICSFLCLSKRWFCSMWWFLFSLLNTSVLIISHDSWLLSQLSMNSLTTVLCVLSFLTIHIIILNNSDLS